MGVRLDSGALRRVSAQRAETPDGDGGRLYDQVTVQLADGTERTLTFDITRYFGRD